MFSVDNELCSSVEIRPEYLSIRAMAKLGGSNRQHPAATWFHRILKPAPSTKAMDQKSTIEYSRLLVVHLSSSQVDESHLDVVSIRSGVKATECNQPLIA
jgi:hypothetical protein